jgi:hypothetical protein
MSAAIDEEIEEQKAQDDECDCDDPENCDCEDKHKVLDEQPKDEQKSKVAPAPITKLAHVIRQPHWLDKDASGSSDDLWAYASVEETDSDGDIIRIAGMNFSAYHNPPSTHLKILAGHAKTLPDGRPPIVGRVEEFRKVSTPDGKPALAFRMSWAPSELGQHYKSLYMSEPPYMDSFSIGASAVEAEPIKGGGWDFKATELAEVSCVTVPANVRANVIRSAEKDELLSKLAALEALLQKMESGVLDSLQKRFESLVERLDCLESSITVAQSEGRAKPTSDRTKATLSLDDLAKQLADLKEKTKLN